MASFSEEVSKATEGLKKFNQALSAGQRFDAHGAAKALSPSGSPGGGLPALPGLGGGAISKAGAIGLAIGAGAEAAGTVAQALTPAAKAFHASGTSAGVATAVTNQLLDSVQDTRIGAFALAVTGVSTARETTQRAGARVGAVTEDLARYGVTVSDEFRQRLANTAIEQEKRVTTERGKVDALTGSAAALDAARPDSAKGGAMGAGFDAIVGVLSRIEGLLRSNGGGRP